LALLHDRINQQKQQILSVFPLLPRSKEDRLLLLPTSEKDQRERFREHILSKIQTVFSMSCAKEACVNSDSYSLFHCYLPVGLIAGLETLVTATLAEKNDKSYLLCGNKDYCFLRDLLFLPLWPDWYNLYWDPEHLETLAIDSFLIKRN
jgi:hypothetical protein